MSQFFEEKADYTANRVVYWNKQHERGANSNGDYYRKTISRLYGYIVANDCSVLEVGCGNGDLLASLSPKNAVGVDFSAVAISQARAKYPNYQFYEMDGSSLSIPEQHFDYIILSDLINDLWDVQEVFSNLKHFCGPQTRLVINFYNYLWNPILGLAEGLRLKSASQPQNWLTVNDVNNLLEISGFEPLRNWQEILVPANIPLANTINRYLPKVFPFRSFSLSQFVVARPAPADHNRDLSVSVVVAARNEAGHIDELINRVPSMGLGTELIFVEGNSTDDTFEVIKKALENRPHLNASLIKQPGKGKGDAVRAGFSIAKNDILMILDADITVPPEDLVRFYELMRNGKGEFINGVRLVYPMQDDAMRFANLIGNKFFSWAFSWLLGQHIRDTLCGTKVISRSNYEKLAKNRSYFGDFDPFGDFDLLFGAAKLNLQIKEVPVRYRARRYGETNISRWKHGVLLLRMVIFAAGRMKFLKLRAD